MAVLLTGRGGTGKTTEFEKRIRSQKKVRIIFIFDHEGEYADRFDKQAITDPDDLVQKTALGGYVVFDPIQCPGSKQEAFEFFCQYVFSVSETVKGRKIFACDELQSFVNPDNEPKNFLNLIERGRRLELDIVCIAQAPNRLHNAVRNQMTEVITFAHTDENAIKYLADQGLDPDKIRSLKNGQWLHKNIKTGEFSEGGKAF